MYSYLSQKGRRSGFGVSLWIGKGQNNITNQKMSIEEVYTQEPIGQNIKDI